MSVDEHMRAVEVAAAMQRSSWTDEQASAVVWALEGAQVWAAEVGLEVEVAEALEVLERG